MLKRKNSLLFFFFFQAEDGIRDLTVTGVQTCALPISDEIAEEDPLAGVANLFDVSVVFIVGLMLTLFSVYRMGDLMDKNSEVTMVKTNAQGEREIIVKKGTQITAYKVTGKTAAGEEIGR